jgi:hypothetical protein
MTTPRSDLTPMTPRIASLPVAENGYPVPWFVGWVDGKPEFRASDPDKRVRAVKESLCWVCGEVLGVRKAFVTGPMCCINRTTAEPPSHYDCAVWSMQNCPILNGLKSKRRHDEQFEKVATGDVPGHMIEAIPKAMAIWICRDFQLFADGQGKGGWLIRMAEPVDGLEFWKDGKRATFEQIQEALAYGLPTLQKIADEAGPESQQNLREYVDRFWQTWGRYGR